MIKIRKGMFETNSSSTHTIILTDNNCEPGAIVDFRIGEFSWEFERLDTVDEKASYLYTAACLYHGRDVYQDLYEILSRYGVKCSCTKPVEFDKEYEGCIDNGYIDHGCIDDLPDFVELVMSDDNALIRYLFSHESFVLTGNDNCYENEERWVEKQLDVPYTYQKYEKGN